MDINTIFEIINGFAEAGIVFSNEQDFQFEFARKIGTYDEVKNVKLEALSLDRKFDAGVNNISPKDISAESKEYTDILIELKTGQYIAIELKYKTPNKAYVYYPETEKKMITMPQGAYDHGCYWFINDIKRLEEINNRHFLIGDIKIEKAYAVLLTNDKNYRFNDFSGSKIWKSYSICEKKKTIGGQLLFNSDELTYKNFQCIQLDGEYELNWRDYELADYKDNYDGSNKKKHPGFSYLVVEVKPKS